MALCSLRMIAPSLGSDDLTLNVVGRSLLPEIFRPEDRAALGDQRVIFGIGLGSVGLESRIRDLPIGLLARPDRIGLGFSAPLRYVDTVDASTIEAEHLLLERRRKLRVAVRLDQRRRDLKASEGLDLVLRRAVPDCSPCPRAHCPRRYA